MEREVGREKRRKEERKIVKVSICRNHGFVLFFFLLFFFKVKILLAKTQNLGVPKR